MATALSSTSGAQTPLTEASLEAAGVAWLDQLPGAAAEFVAAIPISFARRHGIIGLAGDGTAMPLAISSAVSLRQVDIVSRFLNRSVTPILASKQAIAIAIDQGYERQTGQAQPLVDTLSRREVLDEVESLADREDLLDVAARAPVIKLVNLILFEAVQARASDVHIQPTETAVSVRHRIDGVLYDTLMLPKSVQEEVISRIKVMAKMNIAEKRLPQDGRATAEIGRRAIDLRIASLPTTFGERVVIRLLDKSARLYSLPDLGMDPESLRRFRRLIAAEHGIVLVTGPTGSGKTTTLYAALKELDAAKLNILTLEDPVEYRLEGVSQTQISEKKGMSFAGGLRSVLRQDPDIIMVGEIRDRETAAMAIQSALTGHLVFSTLHTNDAASAVARLLDLGVEPYLLASSVIGVLAQRLVRRICPVCTGVASADCQECRGTGFSGRLGIFELLEVDADTRTLITNRATATDIAATAVLAGMKSLRDDGLAKVRAGRTTALEVDRVTSAVGDAKDAVDGIESHNSLSRVQSEP